jgi:hypothetical protein
MASTHQPLYAAIANKRRVSFTLDGFRRLAEPHDYGITNGVARLFFSRIGGGSRSGRPIGWRWVSLSKDLRAVDPRREVCGPRPAPSGRPIDWDVLIATVSPRPVAQWPVAPNSARRNKRWR